ncbi:MAG: 4-alpha-glucanotransferase [Candidatus Binatia bacterium]
MRLPRTSGLLLHPSSLPGPHGLGDLGPSARNFLTFLSTARQRRWQVLPLNPTSVGDSPYQSPSAFAGNPLLISLELLIEDGLLAPTAVQLSTGGEDRVDYARVIACKEPLLRTAARRLIDGATPALSEPFERFRAAEAGWLDDFALFMALKDAHRGEPWALWERGAALRTAAALARWRNRLAREAAEYAALQFLFFRQWGQLRACAAARGISIIGDLPIFVAADSADVWAHRELFQVDAEGRATAVAGVPPDYFSPTGQLWGNPLYDWGAIAGRNFAWWIDRMRAAFGLYDVVRIDHFLAFVRHWAVPRGAADATQGHWQPGPGAAVLHAIRGALGDVPIVAEDLGSTTPEVQALREAFTVPGMKVLQFAFDGDASNPFLPHHYAANCVVYTGTHDNDTTAGWFAKAAPAVRRAALRYVGGVDGEDMAWRFVRLAMASVADTAIAPVQDVLGLGSEARMNHPGHASGNWTWRLRPGALTARHAERLAELAEIYDRAGDAGR